MARTSKRNRFDVKHIPPVMFISEALPGEQFHIIEPIAAHNVLPYYAISTYGRVWHIFERRFMRTSYDGPGYRIAVLRTTEGARTFRVHRIMMLTFNYFDGCEDYMCNHIDGIKTHNWINFGNPEKPECLINNLEWVTAKENQRHAIENGLKFNKNKRQQCHVAPQLCDTSYDYEHGRRGHGVIKRTVPKTKIHERDAIQICEMLSTGQYTTKDVADILCISTSIVKNIKHRQGWNHISQRYTFPSAFHPADE